jgi:ribose transport system permease protein
LSPDEPVTGSARRPAEIQPPPIGHRAQISKYRDSLRVGIPPARRGIWILNVAILLILAILKRNFFGSTNLENVLITTAYLGIGAAGMTILIVAGAFDLSVSAIIGLAPIIAIQLAGTNGNWLLIVLLSVVSGGVLGLVNGLIITRGRVAPFVATLGTLFVFSSVAAIITSGSSLGIANASILNLGHGSVGGLIPYAFLLMLVVFGICHVILRRIHLGRWIRASGSNLFASHVSGIDVRSVYVKIFVLSGLLTGLAGIVLSGYIGTAGPTSFTTYNLSTIAVVVVGGTNLTGGDGTLVGTALGAWLFSVVANALLLFGVNSYWQFVATGGIIVLALALSLVQRGGFELLLRGLRQLERDRS